MTAALFVIIMMAKCSEYMYTYPNMTKAFEADPTTQGVALVLDIFQV